MTSTHTRDGLTLFCGDAGDVLPCGIAPQVRWILTSPPWWGQQSAEYMQTPTPPAPMMDAHWLLQALAFYYSWLPHIPGWLEKAGGRMFLSTGFEQWPLMHKITAWMKWPVRGVWIKSEVAALVLYGQPIPRPTTLAIDDLWQVALDRPTFPPQLVDGLMELVPPDGAVGDPFAGSGMTLFIGHRRGYDAVGIEQERARCDSILAGWDRVFGTTGAEASDGPKGPEAE